MGLESATFVDGLVTSNPVGAVDAKSQGDDHLRLIKTALKNTFPNATRAFHFRTVPAAKTVNYVVVAADENAIIPVDATASNVIVTLPDIASVFAGYTVSVMKIDASVNTVLLEGAGSETIQGVANRTVSRRYDVETLFSDGTEWKVLDTAELFAPAGTKLLFPQAVAPNGWTQDTDQNDKAIRVVSGVPGAGGSVPFSTVFGKAATDGHTLVLAEIPAHTHNYGSGSSGATIPSTLANATGDGALGFQTSSAGSGGSHTHNMDIRVQYMDVMKATKD